MLDSNSVEQMTVIEILCGKGKYFPGLMPIITAYLDTIDLAADERKTVDNYMQFIQARATGELMTTAAWMRKFVNNHNEYKGDSVVSSGIAYDLLKEIHLISEGAKSCPELLGENKIEQPSNRKLYNTALQGKVSRVIAMVKQPISRTLTLALNIKGHGKTTWGCP